MKIYIIPTTPSWWLSNYPPYNSAEGWELEKKLVREQIKKEIGK